MHAAQNVVDLLLEQHPHRPNAAVLRRGAAFLADRVRYAVEIERRGFGRRNHVADRDVVRVFGQCVSAVRTARAPNETGAPQAKENVLDVIRRQLLTLGDFAPSDRSVGDATGKV